MTLAPDGFTVSDAGCERTEDRGRWVVEKKPYAPVDGSAPERFYWEVAAHAADGSISAHLPCDPLGEESVRIHLENAPPLDAGSLVCSIWFDALEAMTDGAALIMDRWLKAALAKRDATSEQLARRSKLIAAARAAGWTIDEDALASFEAGLAQSPDLIASRDDHELRDFVRANLLEACAGGLLVRMLAPSDFDASIRSLDPLVERAGDGATEWVKLARPLHLLCLIRDPSGAWLALDLPS